MADLPDVLGPYRIVSKLGQGGMGAVYEGLHQAISRRVAIKVLHPEYSSNPDIIARFFNEARAVNIVDHPGIVQISDYAQLPDGTAYIVMEHLKGESLGQRLKRAPGQQPLNEILHLTWQIAESLAVAHKKGIIHRDLKPDNVMIVPDSHMASGERTKILDFGLAKLAEAGLVKTKSNQVMGTPLYMSPEQCTGASKVDAKTDVYALGCMLYMMLSGRPPFVAQGLGQVVKLQITQAPMPLRSRVPTVPEKLADFVHQLLEKDKARRPTMAKVAARLESLAKLAPPVQKKVQSPGAAAELAQAEDLGLAATDAPAQSPRSEKRWLFGAVAVGSALLLTVIGCLLAYRSARTPASPPPKAEAPKAEVKATAPPALPEPPAPPAVSPAAPQTEEPKPLPSRRGAGSKKSAAMKSKSGSPPAPR